MLAQKIVFVFLNFLLLWAPALAQTPGTQHTRLVSHLKEAEQLMHKRVLIYNGQTSEARKIK